MLHKIRKAMEIREAGYPLAGLIQVDDAFFKSGVNNGGDKSGRGTNKVPVIAMAAVKDEAITFARMEVFTDVESDVIRSVRRSMLLLVKRFALMGFQPTTSSKTSD